MATRKATSSGTGTALKRAIFPEAVDPSAPFAADSNYSVSTANLVRKLNDAS